MRDFIAFQQFIPQERKEDERCIWCGYKRPKNRSHIISRRLSTVERRNAVLNFSVCADCNASCGKLEQWILRKTPLSLLRLMVYLESNIGSTTKSIPSYFYSESIGHWVIFHLDASKSNYVIPTQLILKESQDTFLITDSPADRHSSEIRTIDHAMNDLLFLTDIRPTLPEDFAPRFLLLDDNVTLIARDQTEADSALETARRSEASNDSRQRIQLANKGEARYHFKWSKINWARFCAKAAYEALCLFEGASRCLDPAYELVRSFVLEGVSKSSRDIIFDEGGPLSDSDVPFPVHIDLTIGQNAPSDIKVALMGCEIGMHSIMLYELQGWVIASVCFSGLPPSTLILAGPNSHLDDFYILIYDDELQGYDFVKLAYDQSKPVIPIQLGGGMLDELLRTYELAKAPNALIY